MRDKYLLTLFFALISMITLGQNKKIRIVPVPKQPEPIFIFDGIRLTSNISKDIFTKDNNELIDSVSIQPDSIFDYNGQLTNLGVVKIFTKDSINIGAKKILELTDNWVYSHPNTEIEINNDRVDWNDSIYYKLTNLKPESIVSAKIKRVKKNNCNSIIKLKIKK